MVLQRAQRHAVGIDIADQLAAVLGPSIRACVIAARRQCQSNTAENLHLGGDAEPDRFGAERADGSEPNVLPEEKARITLSPEEREKKIREAIDEITLKNEVTDFTAGGRPHKNAVSKIVGVGVSQKEVDTRVTKIAEEREAA